MNTFTDLENARAFAEQHRHDLRYVSRSRSWYVWDGKRWRPDDTSEVQRRAKATVADFTKLQLGPQEMKAAIAAQSSGHIAGMIELAKSEPDISITQNQLDTDPWLLNVENGTLDLRTGGLHEHRREDLITKLATVAYDPTAECPRWEAFVAQIMDGDKDRVRYVQKALGYAMTGDSREQCFFILHGTGANGKSTLTTVVAKIAGGYSQHTPTTTLLTKRSNTIPNDVARLYGSRFVTAAEAECNSTLEEALLKQATGGDKMVARFLHGEFFEFTPEFKIFLAVNHKPEIKGTDNAIWRRVRLIPFDVTIPYDEQDRTLPAKLEAERAGILRWLVDGCAAWLGEGLIPPEAVTAATAEYREEMDTVAAFIGECCFCAADAQVPSKRLHDRYREWCNAHGEPTMSKRAFAPA